MKDKLKNKAQLIDELLTLRGQLSELEAQINAREKELKKEMEERRKAEALIKESTEKFRSIFESSNDAIMLLYKKEFFDCNNATLKIFGCSNKEDFLGSHPSDWSPPLQPDGRDSKEAAEEKISDAYRIGRNFFEWMHMRADGEEFPAVVLLTPMRLEGKEVLQATVRDITERKRTEEALSESDERFRNIVENAKVWIWEVDFEGRYTYSSPTVKKILGFKPEEIIGKYFYDFISPDERDIIKEKAYTFFSNKEPFSNLITKKIHKNGATIFCDTAGVPIIDYDGKLVGYRGSVSDITERKETEDALRKSETLLQSVIDNSTTVVYVKDMDGKYLLINSIFEELFHIGREDILAKTDHDIFPKDMAEAFRANDLKVLEAGEPIEFEEVAPHDDGPHTYISVKFPLNDDNGNPYAVCGISTDITERKRTSERIETLNRCFLDFGTDPTENILRLTRLLGTIMNGTCALYNRLDQGMLCSIGQWQTPPGYNPVDKPEGHICYDVIKDKGDDILYVPNLSRTPYAKTDTNVINYKLETYLGKAVTCNGEHVGSLCVVFQDNFVPTEEDRRYLEIIAVAIGIEEERKQAGEALADSREKLRNLSLHLQTMQEQERARIARDIHDDLGQILTALDFDIAYMTKRLLPDQKDLIKKAKKMSELIMASTQTVQRIASELRPALLDDLGLMAAMEWQAEKYHEHTGIQCKIEFDSRIEIYDKKLSTALFRAFQEALTNAARHANATSVSVSVKRNPGRLTLKVSDNGKGITKEEVSDRDSFGLSGMKERFIPFGGKIMIKGIKDKGTTISITIPFGGGK